jgi:hypothetical protein
MVIAALFAKVKKWSQTINQFSLSKENVALRHNIVFIHHLKKKKVKLCLSDATEYTDLGHLSEHWHTA